MRYARTHDRLKVVRLSRSCFMSSVCTTVCNKSKLIVTEAHTISLQNQTVQRPVRKLKSGSTREKLINVLQS